MQERGLTSRSPRSARFAAPARVSGALASQNAPRCIVASSCCNTPGYIVYIECTQAGGRANLEQPARPSEYMHECNFLLVRIFETNFLLNRNPERQIVCCIRFKKIFWAKLDPIWIYFLSFKRVAYQCTTDYNSVYHLVTTSYNFVYYMHLVTIITPSCNSELQSVLNTLQPSYNCVVEVLATHSTTYCNYVFEKKNFIKYSLHHNQC